MWKWWRRCMTLSHPVNSTTLLHFTFNKPAGNKLLCGKCLTLQQLFIAHHWFFVVFICAAVTNLLCITPLCLRTPPTDSHFQIDIVFDTTLMSVPETQLMFFLNKYLVWCKILLSVGLYITFWWGHSLHGILMKQWSWTSLFFFVNFSSFTLLLLSLIYLTSYFTITW